MDFHLILYGSGVAGLALLLGFGRAKSNYSDLNKRDEFALEYLKNFRTFIESKGADFDAYGKLIFHSGKMQEIMGGYGRMDYRPAFANYRITNHPIILNFIPEIKRKIQNTDDGFGLSNLEQQEANWLVDAVHEAIVRYLGSSNDRRDTLRKKLFNPFEWLRLGLERLLAAPIYLLSALGIISGFRAVAAENSVALRYFSGLVALVGLVAGVVEIVVGLPTVLVWLGYSKH